MKSPTTSRHETAQDKAQAVQAVREDTKTAETKGKVMQSVNNLVTQPIDTIRSIRPVPGRLLTSGKAGKIIPVMAEYLFREDAVQSGRVSLKFEMAETVQTLMNGVMVQANAYFLPYLAFERFQKSMDALNRSYKGQPVVEGGDVTPFIHKLPFGAHGSNKVYQALGLHAKATDEVNTAYLEAYNTIVNFRRKMRSKSLPERTLYDTTLAEAFWHHNQFRHIVPSFDQALIDGEVALNIVDPNIEVRGLYRGSNTNGYSGAYSSISASDPATPTDPTTLYVDRDDASPRVFAEMQAQGITVSLANIEMAKKTAAFARLRQQYQGHDDDWIIDLLMSGVRIPDQAMSQPILLAQKNTLFGYSRQAATDGASLGESVTTGVTSIDMNLRLPPVNTGGVLMVTVEITPEQLFERQKDYFLHSTDVAEWPDYVRDYLDPEKVEVVTNSHVDVDHTAPGDVFGYAPLNHKWTGDKARIGGKFYRPEVDAAFDEDRQRIWAVETVDPTLTADFYLCTQMHQKVFADTTADPFEILGRYQLMVSGNTVFGAALRESTGDYDAIAAQAPTDTIEQE